MLCPQHLGDRPIAETWRYLSALPRSHEPNALPSSMHIERWKIQEFQIYGCNIC
jgi:hypothetical protein